MQSLPETRKALLVSASGDPVLRGLMRNQGVQSAAEPDRISAGFHRRVRGTDSAAASFSPQWFQSLGFNTVDRYCFLQQFTVRFLLRTLTASD